MNEQLLAKAVIKLLSKSNSTLSVAESVTAGGVASALTEVAGASKVFLGGVIVYSDDLKISQLEVSKSGFLLFFMTEVFNPSTANSFRVYQFYALRCRLDIIALLIKMP